MNYEAIALHLTQIFNILEMPSVDVIFLRPGTLIRHDSVDVTIYI